MRNYWRLLIPALMISPVILMVADFYPLFILTFTTAVAVVRHGMQLLATVRDSTEMTGWSYYFLVITVMYGVLAYSYVSLIMGRIDPATHLVIIGAIGPAIILHPSILLEYKGCDC